MNVVVDTSVILSAAILPGSVPGQAIEFVLDNGNTRVSQHNLASVAEA